MDKTEEKKFTLIIEVSNKGSQYTAKGDMNIGLIKLIIGELDHIKYRLLFDLERSLKDGYER